MKYFLFVVGILLALSIKSQSLLDADSIVVVQETDSTYTALAVTIYSGISANALKSIFKDRYDKSNRLKLQSARTALQYEEKAKKDEAKFTEITGDTIAIDSFSLDGDWTISGDGVTIEITIADNQSTDDRVKLKVISSGELLISYESIGEIPFYKQDENTWLGKGKALYKMIREKPKGKSK